MKISKSIIQSLCLLTLGASLPGLQGQALQYHFGRREGAALRRGPSRYASSYNFGLRVRPEETEALRPHPESTCNLLIVHGLDYGGRFRLPKSRNLLQTEAQKNSAQFAEGTITNVD